MARITVRHRASGQLGTIEENEYDPVQFEAIDQTKKDPRFNLVKAAPALLGGLMGAAVGGPLGAAAGAGLGQLASTLLGRLTGPVTPEQAGGNPQYGRDIADAAKIAGTTAQVGALGYGLQQAGPLLQRLVGGAKGRLGGVSGKLPIGGQKRLVSRVGTQRIQPEAIQDFLGTPIRPEKGLFTNIPAGTEGQARQIAGQRIQGLISQPRTASDLLNQKRLLGEQAFSRGASQVERGVLGEMNQLLRDLLIEQTPATAADFASAQRGIQLAGAGRRGIGAIEQLLPWVLLWKGTGALKSVREAID